MSRIERTSDVSGVVIRQIGGDLRVQGHAGAGIRIEGDDPEVIEDSEHGILTVQDGGDCTLSMPKTADLRIQSVGGDAKITDLDGAVSVEAVGSDLSIRCTGPATIGNVGSDLTIKYVEGDVIVSNVGSDLVAKNVTGNVSVETVSSDCLVHAVQGDLTVETVGSDLSVRDVAGSCHCPSIGSDAILSLAFDAEKSYLFGAGSDVVCAVTPDTRARFILPKRTDIDINRVEAELAQSEDGQIVTLGEGGPDVHISRADSLTLTPEGRGRQIGIGVYVDLDKDIEEQIGNLEAQINQSLKGLSEKIEQQTQQAFAAATDFTNHFIGKRKRHEADAERARERAGRAQERAERIRQRAEERLQRAQERAERFQQRAEERVWRDQPKRKRSGEWEPISQEERLVILQMLEAGTLTVDQAEQLLNALEGNE